MSVFVLLGFVALFCLYTSMGRTFLLLFGTIAVMFFGYWVG
jgi:hypothetical protein